MSEPEILLSVDLAKTRREVVREAFLALCDRVRAGGCYALAAEAVGIERRHELTRAERDALVLIRDAATPAELKAGSAAPFFRLYERPWERVARLEREGRGRREFHASACAARIPAGRAPRNL